MLMMFLKMSALTALYVLLTGLLWKAAKQRMGKPAMKLLVGLIYGLCSVLSTHFGVNFGPMMLNVRDMGPLCAGLFFDPFSGILAGLIGGVERFIAGTYWGIGSYTRIACSLSTVLAGFLAAAVNRLMLRRKMPSPVYAFFTGALMEVFHMYVIFVTHRDDLDMAFYVVRVCAPPMIIFTALGMGVSAAVILILTGEWKNPLVRVPPEENPIARKFRFWLFTATASVLVITMLFSFGLETQSAIQSGKDLLRQSAAEARNAYLRIRETEDRAAELAGETAREDAVAISKAVSLSGGLEKADAAFLEEMRTLYQLTAVAVIGRDGRLIASAGSTSVYSGLLYNVLEGNLESRFARVSAARMVAGARCEGGMIQTVIDTEGLSEKLGIDTLREALVRSRAEGTGFCSVIRTSGRVLEGGHAGETMDQDELTLMMAQPQSTPFSATLFNVEGLCQTERLDAGTLMLMQLPLEDIYADRDAQAYETALADIILFAVIYFVISMLVQGIVVNNLQRVKSSLDRIAKGHLDEVVSVRASSEFASLSDDINQTVDVLKGYIDSAEKRMEQELEFARVIQESALPKNFKFPRNDFSLWALMDPAKEVGGDFYDFFFLGENRLALVIADVSGKGIPASLFMMRSKTTIRGLTESGLSPSEILTRANNALCEGNEAEMFVTVWLGIIDLSTGKMICANAGHEYPVIMRAGGDYEYFRDKHGLALAGMEGMRYKDYELDLRPGDRLFVYTDGVPEAINPQVEQYGADRLLSVLNQEKDSPLDQMLPALRRDIEDFAAGEDQFDDITMLGFVYNGPEGQA